MKVLLMMVLLMAGMMVKAEVRRPISDGDALKICSKIINEGWVGRAGWKDGAQQVAFAYGEDADRVVLYWDGREQMVTVYNYKAAVLLSFSFYQRLELCEKLKALIKAKAGDIKKWTEEQAAKAEKEREGFNKLLK